MRIKECKSRTRKKPSLQVKTRIVPSGKSEKLIDVNTKEKCASDFNVVLNQAVKPDDAEKDIQPIVIRYTKRRNTPGVEVRIVIKKSDDRPIKAEVNVASGINGAKVNTIRIEKETKKTISVLEAVNSEIEKDYRDRQRLMSMCSE